MAFLSYLLKMGGTKNEHIIRLSKEIWHYLLNHNMYITAEYLPSGLNTVAARESSQEKKQTLQSGFFIPKFFKSFLDYQVLRQQIYLLPAYAKNWNKCLPYVFPPFSMISRMLLKIKQECVPLLILITPVWVPRTLHHLYPGTSAAAPGTRNFDKPKKYIPSIDGGKFIDTSGWVGFRKTLLREEISENVSHIITNSRRKGTFSNYKSAWKKWAS